MGLWVLLAFLWVEKEGAFIMTIGQEVLRLQTKGNMTTAAESRSLQSRNIGVINENKELWVDQKH